MGGVPGHRGGVPGHRGGDVPGQVLPSLLTESQTGVKT